MKRATPLVVLRSAIFALVFGVGTLVFTPIALLTFPLPSMMRNRIIALWAFSMVFAARFICGIRWEVRGKRYLPRIPTVILAKHQSAWETMAFQLLFPAPVFVVKRSLLLIPFFGWGLAMTSPIAIDREAGRDALKQLVAQGRNRIRKGFWVVVFPEGTRMAPGERGRYRLGGAQLAVKTARPVLPVAHNAGELWSRRAFLKFPGKIIVSIGPLIETTNRSATEVTREAESWIEAEMARLALPAET